MSIQVLGVDLGKSSFHVVGHDAKGNILLRKKFSRSKLLLFLTTQPRTLVAMECCPGAHWLGRHCQEAGHQVRLLPPQYVKPYVKTNKNDFIDADAIAEAANRPSMRTVAVKDQDTQIQSMTHRLRDTFVKQRTATMNQVHAFLLEFGIEWRKGHPAMRQLPDLLGNAESRLPVSFRQHLMQLYEHYRYLNDQVAELDRSIEHYTSMDERCQRLMTIPGIGPQISSNLVAEIGNASQFKNGRDLGKWDGLPLLRHLCARLDVDATNRQEGAHHGNYAYRSRLSKERFRSLWR